MSKFASIEYIRLMDQLISRGCRGSATRDLLDRLWMSMSPGERAVVAALGVTHVCPDNFHTFVNGRCSECGLPAGNDYGLADLTAEEWAALGLLCQQARYDNMGNREESNFYLTLQVRCDVRCARARDQQQERQEKT